MRKINLLSGLLLIYLLIMGIIGWPGNKPDPDYPTYSLVMGFSLIAVLLLRYLHIRRYKWRKKWEKEKEEQE
jgi:hypothetical protein